MWTCLSTRSLVATVLTKVLWFWDEWIPRHGWKVVALTMAAGILLYLGLTHWGDRGFAEATPRTTSTLR